MNKEFTDFLNNLPEEFSSYNYSYREFVEVTENGDYLVKDIPIEGIIVDEETKEICFVNGNSWDKLKNND